ncbi:Uncharacterised protein [uncultured Bacteroides sp.]|nr:Uncharacterised protein [uncultured Bacteroides sp.]
MLISLYTSRKILEALGISDFGILNVVGGVISMLTFLNGSMSVATQRFLTFELGRNDKKSYNRTFNMSLIIHLGLATIVLIAAETIGLWFVNTYLNIPDWRMIAANWVYQASVLSTILGIVQTPYHASIVSHEHMYIYAYVGLGESFGKLFLVLLLIVYPYDRLIFWGFVMFAFQFLIAIIYRVYCGRKFPECKIHLKWDKTIFNSMAKFTGWNMFGTIAWLLKDQGVNILMNIFGGPVANAARGVANQIAGAINGLTGGFQSAVNPQITKRYAACESGAMCKLLCESSKISYLLLLFIALPVMMEIDFILELWLVEVPPMASLFTCIIIIEALFGVLGTPMITSLMATGNIKWYQIIVGSSLLFIVPVAYLLLKIGYPIVTALIVSALFILLGDVLRLIFCKKQIGLSLRKYVTSVVFPITAVTILSSVLPFFIHYNMIEGWTRFLLSTFVTIISVAIFTYFIGLTLTERSFIVNAILPKLKDFIHIKR